MHRWTILAIVSALILVAGIVLIAIPGKEARAPGPEAPAPASPTVWQTERGNSDILRNISVTPGQEISSPLVVRGEARGTWYFEASFPIALTNWDGLIIAEVPAQAVLDPNDPNSTWMTEEYVPFEATLTFERPVGGDPAVNRGTLILQKDNPSGLPEHDDALEIPVVFK